MKSEPRIISNSGGLNNESRVAFKGFLKGFYKGSIVGYYNISMPGLQAPQLGNYTWVVVRIRVPFGVPELVSRCRIILGIQKGTVILTTTHMSEG